MWRNIRRQLPALGLVLLCLIPVIHTVEPRDYRFAVTFSLGYRGRPPRVICFQKPAIVIEDRFAWLRVRVHLDPALNTEQAGYAAQNYRLLRFFYQLAA